MKKLITTLLILLMAFTLLGCNSNVNKQPTIDKQEEVVTQEEPEIVGGFVDVEDGALTDELKDIFNSALEGLIGATYEPQELVATQVVAGTNYKFLAKGTKTTNPLTEGTYYITIYKDLQGNVELKDIEVIEEYPATPKKVDTEMNYWVVFYNPDGMELDRQAIKYGTTPTYKGEDPIYWDNDYWYRFICWTDSQGNDIKEFKPITGNTYIYAKYEIGGELKPSTDDSIPVVTHRCRYGDNPDLLPNLLYISNIDEDYVYCTVYTYNSITGEYVSPGSTNKIDINKFESAVEVGQWIHTACNITDDPITFNVCEGIDAHNTSCLAGNTLITMANGEKKKVEELKTGDEIVAFDHNTGKKTTSYVIDFFKYDEPRDGVFTLYFDEDTEVTIVGGHSFYEKESNKYVTLYKNDAHNYLGKSFYNVDEGKWVRLNKINYSNEKVETYIVITDKTLNFSANGVLSVEDDIYTLIANVFEFDSNLKIDAAKKEADLNKWGYWSFDNLKYMNKEGYDALNLKYLSVAIGKGMITQEEILAEEAYAATFESDYIE